PYLEPAWGGSLILAAKNQSAPVSKPAEPKNCKPPLGGQGPLSPVHDPHFNHCVVMTADQALGGAGYDLSIRRPLWIKVQLGVGARGQFSLIGTVRVGDVKRALLFRIGIAYEDKLLVIRRKADAAVNIFDQLLRITTERRCLIKHPHGRTFRSGDEKDIVAVRREAQPYVNRSARRHDLYVGRGGHLSDP